MSHSRFGYSAVSSFEKCPYQYKLSWLDGLDTIPTDDPTNALILGTAVHRAIETDIDTALREYFMSYNVITDLHINEAIKIQHLLPKVKAILPDGFHEVPIEYGAFKGTIDLLVPIGDDIYDMYDFNSSDDADFLNKFGCYFEEKGYGQIYFWQATYKQTICTHPKKGRINFKPILILL